MSKCLLLTGLCRYSITRHHAAGGKASRAFAADAQRSTAPAPVGRQDLLIPRAGNQVLRSRAGSIFIYACVGVIRKKDFDEIEAVNKALKGDPTK